MNKLAQLPSAGAAIVKWGTPKFRTFLKYAKVEMTPPSFSEIGEVRKGFQHFVTGFSARRISQLTVKQAWLNILVGTEVICWFFVGEIIGRRSLGGYFVPPIPLEELQRRYPYTPKQQPVKAHH